MSACPKKQVLKNIHRLSCPVCGTPNPVSRVNTRLKCNKCGTNLIAIKVNKRGGRNGKKKKV